MAAILANIMSCSVGTDEFQVTDLSWRDEPIMKDGLERGRAVSARIDGWIDNDKLAAFLAVAGRNGMDVIVRGVGGVVLHSILAAQCVNCGPFIAIEQTKMAGTTAGSVNLSLSVSGQTTADPLKDEQNGGNAQTIEAPGNEISYSVRADLLADVTVSGEASGPGAETSVIAVVSDVRARYPWPGYVVKHTQKLTGTGDKREFTISVERMAIHLPAGGGTRAVEGTYSVSLAVDGEGVRTTTVSYDLVCDNDPMQLESVLRAALAGKYIVASNVEVGGYKERRLRCSYVCVSSDFLGQVIQWTQTVEIEEGEEPTARVVEYEGVGVALVYNQAKGKAKTFKQSGSAVGIQAWPKPPRPLAPTGWVLAENPRIRREQVDAWRHRTTWDYTYIGVGSLAGAAVTALLAEVYRHADPDFEPAVMAGTA